MPGIAYKIVLDTTYEFEKRCRSPIKALPQMPVLFSLLSSVLRSVFSPLMLSFACSLLDV